jgi:hypothetical protein
LFAGLNSMCKNIFFIFILKSMPTQALYTRLFAHRANFNV